MSRQDKDCEDLGVLMEAIYSFYVLIMILNPIIDKNKIFSVFC